ncbi:IS66 family insertion sequence element accessory protein TnpA [Chondromyces apiculatus]|nr:hypothetical protein [Chondromyces apiculatus]
MATRAEWAERVERWKRSGLRAPEFGQAEGLKPQQLHWWSWKLRTTQQAERKPPMFLPVRVVSSSTAVVSAIATRAPAPIELVLPNGCLVRVAEGFDAETLERVLQLAAEMRP